MKSNPYQKLETKSKTKENQSMSEGGSGETPTEFSFKITRVAVSQICRSVGFKASHFSAIETLTLITTKYLEQVAKLASSYSNESNRTQSNLFDLINALHDLSSPIQGFVGAASASNSCLLRSGVLEEISGFVNRIAEIPFAKPIPNNNKRLSMCQLKRPKSSRGLQHIPKWLPAFPEAGTYKECKEMVCIATKNNELWENSELVLDKGVNGGVVEAIVGGNLAAEREKVMFKFGVIKAGDGLCWNTNTTTEIDEKNSGFKRKKLQNPGPGSGGVLDGVRVCGFDKDVITPNYAGTRPRLYK